MTVCAEAWTVEECVVWANELRLPDEVVIALEKNEVPPSRA